MGIERAPEKRQRRAAKVIACVLVCACAVAFFSCASLSVPGEAAIRAKELGAEYYAIAEEWMTAKKYQRAAVWYEKARAFPDYTNAATLQLARAYAFMGNWTDSAREYEALIAQDPLNTLLLSSYAYVLANLGDMPKALDVYKGLVERNEADSVLMKNYVTLLSLAGDFEGARRELDAMKALYPDNEATAAAEKRLADEEAKMKAAEAAGGTQANQPEALPAR